MLVCRTTAELREHLTALRSRGDAPNGIGFVPTMGALHDGHLSLVAASRKAHSVTVLSIFVNPKQFDDGNDFAQYPRTEEQDHELARAAGVDVVFAPEPGDMYPEGFGTTVSVDSRLTSVLEGAVRGPEHFDGVTTVVCKLLLAVQPDAAYFGDKDFQQLLVVKRMVTDLGIPVRVVGCPTMREPDGLARSSRNVRLKSDERERAVAIPQALALTAAAVQNGVTDIEALREGAVEQLRQAGLEHEYLAFVHPDTLEPVTSITGPTICAVAVPVGDVRLIDNELLVPRHNAERTPHVG